MTFKIVPLTNYHEHLKAKFTVFAGYRLPLYYTSISSEHMAVRERVGIFDVSHMGRLEVLGSEAESFLNYLTANDVTRLVDGKMQYSLILNENGGIKDDVTVYRLSEDRFIVVVNAANRDKIFGWFMRNRSGYRNLEYRDITSESVMLAIQGPLSTIVYEEVFGEPMDLKRFHFKVVNDLLVSRSGYTGEDGFEVMVFSANKRRIFELFSTFLRVVRELGGQPCGLGARDTLRLEAGYCLYGNDIDETINPYEASLDWVVKLDKGDFIGRKALIEAPPPKRRRTGFLMTDSGIPRRGYKLFKNSEEVGWISSGGFSPLLKRGMAMIYIDVDYMSDGVEVEVDVRGRMRKGVVKDFPLYDKKRYGYTREKR